MLFSTTNETESRFLNYHDSLRNYLNEGGEIPLQDAYDLGRKNLAQGNGLLDIAMIHQQALTTLLKDNIIGEEQILTRMSAANLFLNEVLSPFEMSRRVDNDSKKVVQKLFVDMEDVSHRIAHRLHDDCAQMLAVVYLELAEISRQGSQSTASQIQKVVTHLDDVCNQLRGLSHELRPLVLEQFGLIPAIKTLAAGVSKRSGLIITLTEDGCDRIASPVEIALYRTVQEALVNMVRHARASVGQIHIWVQHDIIYCKIKDNGVGFESPEKTIENASGLGLLGIQERVRALGGTYKIVSTPGVGTELHVGIPL